MLHARIVRPPSYHCKLVKINEYFEKRLVENDITLFVKGSFVAILSQDEFLVTKFLEIAKKNIFWEEKQKLSNENVFNSLEKHEKESLLVKSGGEAFYEEIPEKKSFDDPKIKSLSTIFKKLFNAWTYRTICKLCYL